MKKFSLLISKAAEKDLNGIVDYIKDELKAPINAQKRIAKLKTAILELEELLERYTLVRDEYLAQKGIHMIPVDSYIIFYKVNVENAHVKIVRILHGKRDWKNLL